MPDFFFSKFPRVLIVVGYCSLFACANNSIRGNNQTAEDYEVSSLIKKDIGEVIEVHVKESRNHLREMMVKLYKRNPRELIKSEYASTIEENVVRLFDLDHGWQFSEFKGKYGSEVIIMTFSSEFQGDRVYSLMAGLLYMLMEAYNNKKSFYLFQASDAQNLYNLARNIEIAVWKLGNTRDDSGELYLYSNSLANEETNSSYERLFGKLISLQDTMAIIISERTDRTIIKVIQQMVSAVFLPIL
ncbi:MAG: hypothetical protein ACKVHQ_02110 [Gammaproteobacteria bacterium]